MKRTAKELRAEARKVLTGRYWRAFFASLIAALLGGIAQNSGGAAAGGSAGAQTATDGATTTTEIQAQLTPEMAEAFAAVGGIVLAIAAVSLVILLLIGGAVELGYDTFNLKLYESNEKPSIGLLFSRFDIFGKALWLRILTYIKTFLWTLLFVIPGIIASYRYRMAPYAMAENPSLAASEAIEKSKTLMAGNKWRLFCLDLSFIGWYLLALLTAGIGFVLLQPYVKAAETAFYRELTAPAAAPVAEPVAA